MKLSHLLCSTSFINSTWSWSPSLFHSDVSIVPFTILLHFNVVNTWNKPPMAHVYWAKNELLCILNHSSKANNLKILIESTKKLIVFLLEP